MTTQRWFFWFKDSPPAIYNFRRSLSTALQWDLLQLPTPLKDLEEWYTWANQLDNNFRKMQCILGWSVGKISEKGKEEPKWRWNIQQQDPDAMDVDSLTVDKWGEMMKKELCFNCNKPGHISKFCPEKQKATTSSPPPYTLPKKMALKEFVAHIWSITALMGPEEKEEFLDEAEKEGF